MCVCVSEYDRGNSQSSPTECGVSECDRRTSQMSPTECGVSECDRGTSQMSPTECVCLRVTTVTSYFHDQQKELGRTKVKTYY